MTELASLLVGTVALRPYVFAFFAVHLVAATVAFGGRRAALLTGLVWGVAFAAEFSSTRTGIPFGRYTYLGLTRGRELYLADVPFMDSLSFTFLAFAAYATALAFLAPLAPAPGRRLPRPVVTGRLARRPATLLLAATLFMLSDVVIDPVALRGDRWFLGPVFAYPAGGLYFGVPLSNFAGWFVVGTVGLGLYQAADGWLARSGADRPVRGGGVLAGVALYYAVVLFALAVTAAIGERQLAAVGAFLYLLPTLLLALRFLDAVRADAPSPRAAAPEGLL